MQYAIFDCGSIGLELARQWVEAGHEVVGTTPEPEELPRIEAVCQRAVLLPQEDADQARELAGGADSVVLCVRPRLYAASVRERALAYRRAAVGVRAAASVQRRLVLVSSIVVYGRGESAAPEPDGWLSEQSPVTTSLDPAGQGLASLERIVLESPAATVLRMPEMVTGDPDEPDPVDFLRTLYDQTGGVLPFDGEARAHTIDYRDAAAATAFVVAHELTGVYNVVPEESAPPTNEAFVAKLAADLGLPPVSFTDQQHSPRRPVSAAKLRAAGFTFRAGTVAGG